MSLIPARFNWPAAFAVLLATSYIGTSLQPAACAGEWPAHETSIITSVSIQESELPVGDTTMPSSENLGDQSGQGEAEPGNETQSSPQQAALPPAAELDPELERLLNAVKTVYDNRPIDGVTALTILFLGSFLVDRVASALLFLLYLSGYLPESGAGTEKQRRQARASALMAYYLFAIVATVGLLTLFQNFHLFRSLGFTDMPSLVDKSLTGIILVVGAERVAGWLKLPGTPGAESAAPVYVTGEMTLREDRENDTDDAVQS